MTSNQQYHKTTRSKPHKDAVTTFKGKTWARTTDKRKNGSKEL